MRRRSIRSWRCASSEPCTRVHLIRQARPASRELCVGVFPEQRGEPLAALRRAVLQREKGEQGAGFAGRDLERPVIRPAEIEAAEQAQAQHGPQAYRESRGDRHLYR